MRIVPMVAAFLATTPALAQTYPAKPIRFVVPFAAGTAVDLLGRTVSERMSAALKQPIVIENRPGAQATIGTEVAARAPADGYTVLVGSTTSNAAGPFLVKKANYDPVKDFDGITRLGTVAYALAVHPSLPVRNADELVALAKRSPGKVNYAYGSSGGLIPAAIFVKRKGIDLPGIPYKSPPQAMVDVVGGQVGVIFADLAGSLAYLRSGRLKPLAMTTEKPSPYFPEVPLLSKTLPGFEYTTWFGLYVPAGVPRDTLQTLHRAALQAMEAAETRERLRNQAFEVVTSTPEEAKAFTAREVAKISALIKEAGIQPE